MHLSLSLSMSQSERKPVPIDRNEYRRSPDLTKFKYVVLVVYGIWGGGEVL